jgi:iron complex transport system substrate-binding protein
VSLHDVTSEAVVELEASACLVGISEPTDLPDAVRQKLAHVPRVGSSETVLARKPSVVLGLDVVREHEPALAEALANRKVPFYAPRLERLEQVRELVEQVGKLIDRKVQAETWVARFPPASEPSAANPRRVLVFDCCAPPFTAGKHALVSDLLRHAGAENVFADVDDTWFHTSWEAAVARRPELILIDDYGAEGGLSQKRAMLEQISPLKGLPVLVLPLRDLLGTIRTPQVLEKLKHELSRSRG